jgi:DNA-binding transcriptional regulator YiaG
VTRVLGEVEERALALVREVVNPRKIFEEASYALCESMEGGGNMGKLEGVIKSEIVRFAKRETGRISLPLRRDVRTLKRVVSQLRKSVLTLERLTAQQQRELRKGRAPLEALPDEVKKSRFSPRLIRNLRQRLGITQKEMATLAGVTVGAIYQWEQGIFEPRGKKRGILVALRKLGRRAVKKLLEEKAPEVKEKKVVRRSRKRVRK